MYEDDKTRARALAVELSRLLELRTPPGRRARIESVGKRVAVEFLCDGADEEQGYYCSHVPEHAGPCFSSTRGRFPPVARPESASRVGPPARSPLAARLQEEHDRLSAELTGVAAVAMRRPPGPLTSADHERDKRFQYLMRALAAFRAAIDLVNAGAP